MKRLKDDQEEGEDNSYKVLGCREDASSEELKKKYHELALKVRSRNE